MNMTPQQIVAELDKYIIGQDAAKKSVAIAMRNRWRRQQAPENLRDEIFPNNIILIGPTGVGKTEIARRLAKLDHSPFVKVEASKFTEVGYVGRDVESIIRDLVDQAVNMVRSEYVEEVQEQAEDMAKEQLLDLMVPPPPISQTETMAPDERDDLEQRHFRAREEMRRRIKAGEVNDVMVELEVPVEQTTWMQIVPPMNLDDMGMSIPELLNPAGPQQKKRRKMPVPEALTVLQQEETHKLIDMDDVVNEAIYRVEESGIVFLDEIDKIAGDDNGGGPDVSRQGVQRDLLPVIEGTNVFTKYGMVRSDHILFIASGAFHVSKPSDLIPEIQGRFPIRVELDNLGADEFKRILTEPENALIKQYKALVATESAEIEFDDDALDEIATSAYEVNQQTENIGARRLHTILSNILEETLFQLPDPNVKTIRVTRSMVQDKLREIIEDEDLSQYIL